MTQIAIVVGTTLGNAEYIADEIEAHLTALKHDVTLYLTPNLAEIIHTPVWIIVSSTHGAGDLPENIQPFFHQIEQEKPDLQHINFALCALGDSSYDTFCLGPEKLMEAIKHCGSISIVDKIQIDMQYDLPPEDIAIKWLTKWKHLL